VLLLVAMTTYIGMNGPATKLRIKLMEVLYVLRVRQWFSILRSQVDVSKAVDLCHPEGTLPTGGEFVATLPREHRPEHYIVHLELSATHEPLMIMLYRLAVPCIFYCRIPSSLIDEDDIFTPELVLRGYVICLNTEGAHGDTKKKGVSPVARLLMSNYPIMRTEAHQSTSCHVSPIHHRCGS
jgi:hypothetical protein